MENNNNEERLEQAPEIAEDVVTVELGKEAEVLAPVEVPEVVEEVKEEVLEEEVKEEEKEKPEEVKEEEVTDTPTETEETKEETKEEEKSEETDTDVEGDADTETESTEEPEPVEETVDELAEERAKLEALQAEIYTMRDAEETRVMIEERNVSIQNAARIYDDFNGKLKMALMDTFAQYGIDPNIELEELQKDPAKLQVAQDIIKTAERLQHEKQAELMAPIHEMSNKIVFKEAGKVMASFDMTEEQSTIAAETFINILNATGLSDLKEDLKAKMELAVARAKMLAPKVEKAVEAAKEVIGETIEAIKDVKETSAPAKTLEDALDNVMEETEKKEPVVKEEKPTLDAFKEGVVTEEATSSTPVETVSADNVLDLLRTIPFKERAAFFKANQKAIDEAMTRKHKELGR